MYQAEFMEAVLSICGRDARYDPQAYVFIREALDFTVKRMEKPVHGPGRHVSGKELLDGLRLYALQEYGPLARMVLSSWGIERTEDFGEMVFNLVDAGKLGSTEEDSKQDFAGGYSFEEAFTAPFLPAPPTDAPERNKPQARSGAGSRNDH